jgi:Ala-tRNA(Pro) deacylase
MAIATTLKQYLDAHHVAYTLVPHPRTGSSMETAESAHVSGDALVKAVVLRDERGYLMAVLPSTHHLRLETVQRVLNRDLQMASEEELSRIFPDCEPGAVPPIGEAYRLEVLLDEGIPAQGDIYFEAGDHTDLIKLSSMQFQQLMARAKRGSFSHHM